MKKGAAVDSLSDKLTRLDRPMSWISLTLRSSIGKKTLVALSGGFLFLFVLVHLAGNATLYRGTHAFASYAAKLHSLGIVIAIFEIVLLTAFVLHIFCAVFVLFQNYCARPDRYAVKKNAGGRTWGSKTMPYTGSFILIFVIFHLNDFHFVPESLAVADIVRTAFASQLRTFFYLCALTALTLHLSHGLWSLAQTLGLDHPKYTPPIKQIAVYGVIALGALFAGIPLILFLWPHLIPA